MAEPIEISSQMNRLVRERAAILGGGSGGEGMEPRVAKLEALAESMDKRLDLIERDVRSLFKGGIAAFVVTWIGLIAVALGLAGLMAKGFGWL